MIIYPLKGEVMVTRVKAERVFVFAVLILVKFNRLVDVIYFQFL